jgi:hypothetical protein
MRTTSRCSVSFSLRTFGAGIAAILLVGGSFPGCASDQGGSQNGANGGLDARDTRGLRESERTVRVTGASERAVASPEAPALVVGSETLTMAQIAPMLAEASGAQIIEELLITRTAERELARAGRALSREDIERERVELTRALASAEGLAGGTDPDLLIDSVRRARGLGEERFSMLVRRTAALRKLIEPEVEVTDAEVALAHQVRYGTKYRVRLLLTATEREAAVILAELAPLDEMTRRARFIQLAIERSIDASAGAGGLLEPISPVDPAYPMIVRTTLPGLTPRTLGPVLALNPNYAVVLLEEIIPDQGVAQASVEQSLREDLRRRQERIMMDRRAQAILDATPVTVLDPSLQWSWRTRTGRRTE